MRYLSAMRAEVLDICDDLHWVFQDFEYWPDIPLEGFQFHPPGSEPVWMTFDQNGVLIDPVVFVLPQDSHRVDGADEDVVLSAVTQYAGQDGHMALIDLLRYLGRKYFTTFNLTDESLYWETQDTDICREQFSSFTIYMDELAQKLESSVPNAIAP